MKTVVTGAAALVLAVIGRDRYLAAEALLFYAGSA